MQEGAILQVLLLSVLLLVLPCPTQPVATQARQAGFLGLLTSISPLTCRAPASLRRTTASTQPLCSGPAIPQIVNLQSASEFASHRMNRDTWRNDMVRSLVENNFILLQVSAQQAPIH